jgi:hypothetical protein
MSVSLTARQQALLAQLAVAVRPAVKRVHSGQEPLWADLADRISNWASYYEVTPQELDSIYEIMHRTGEQS